MTMMIRSVASTMGTFIRRPAATVTTLLYYSNQLPRNLNLERLVSHHLLSSDNYLFYFIINFMRCFW